MAYKQEDIKQELLKVIKDKNIVFLDHAFAYTYFSKTTCYVNKLNESNDIKEAVEINRSASKNKMLGKWLESDNATLQIAAFRLMSTPEEHKLLNQQYIDHTTEGEKLIFKPIDLDVEE